MFEPKSTKKPNTNQLKRNTQQRFRMRHLQKLQLRTYIVLLACLFQNFKNRALAYTTAPN